VFLPHNFETTNCVAYTGTHDNDTTQGLFESLDDESLVLIADYLTGEKNSVEKTKKLLASKKLTKAFVKSIFASTASIAVVPLQDVYTLGTYARMNTPSTSGTNWAWRAEKGQISGTKAEKAAAWLKNLCVLYAR
ncbi:MAG: 4-alpha-glucanotransferase, partial [Treponema sp.]|nr:4-alpha-glucanotransferase [Treponema sp.]